MLYRTLLIVFTIILNLGSINATADQATEEMKKCATSSDDSARLACFDALLKSDDESPGTPAMPDTPAASSTPAISSTPAASSTPAVTSTPALPIEEEEMEESKEVESASAREPVSNTPEQDFGIEQKKAIEAAPESIESIAVEVHRASHRKPTITLENGQVWRQTDGRRLSIKDGQPIVITRGTFNSFFMQTKSGHSRIRVERIK